MTTNVPLSKIPAGRGTLICPFTSLVSICSVDITLPVLPDLGDYYYYYYHYYYYFAPIVYRKYQCGVKNLWNVMKEVKTKTKTDNFHSLKMKPKKNQKKTEASDMDEIA